MLRDLQARGLTVGKKNVRGCGQGTLYARLARIWANILVLLVIVAAYAVGVGLAVATLSVVRQRVHWTPLAGDEDSMIEIGGAV